LHNQTVSNVERGENQINFIVNQPYRECESDQRNEPAYSQYARLKKSRYPWGNDVLSQSLNQLSDMQSFRVRKQQWACRDQQTMIEPILQSRSEEHFGVFGEKFSGEIASGLSLEQQIYDPITACLRQSSTKFKTSNDSYSWTGSSDGDSTIFRSMTNSNISLKLPNIIGGALSHMPLEKFSEDEKNDIKCNEFGKLIKSELDK